MISYQMPGPQSSTKYHMKKADIESPEQSQLQVLDWCAAGLFVAKITESTTISWWLMPVMMMVSLVLRMLYAVASRSVNRAYREACRGNK